MLSLTRVKGSGGVTATRKGLQGLLLLKDCGLNCSNLSTDPVCGREGKTELRPKALSFSGPAMSILNKALDSALEIG